MAVEAALLLSAALLVTIVVALISKSMSVTLIMLFYSSLVLGLIFTIYSGVLVGLLHIITFAGAISVMLLTVVLMTGESKMEIGSRQLALALFVVTSLVAGAASFQLYSSVASTSTPPQLQSSTEPLGFIWQFRPWDLLILVIVFACSMIAVANLLSRED